VGELVLAEAVEVVEVELEEEVVAEGVELAPEVAVIPFAVEVEK
jgi:hypothetical protein